MKYNDDIIYNMNYLVILPVSSFKYKKYIMSNFDNVIEYDPHNDFNYIIQYINNNNFKQLIFVDYDDTYPLIINQLYGEFIIKNLFTYDLGGLSNKENYYKFNMVYKMLLENKISFLGVLDLNIYNIFKERSNNISYVLLDIPMRKQIRIKNKKNIIGVLSDCEMNTHSFYNSLSGIKLSGFYSGILNKTKEVKSFLKIFNIKHKEYKTNNDLYNEAILTLNINFTDTFDYKFIESMDNNIPCIIGNNNILKDNDFLKNELMVHSDDDIDEISLKIKSVIKNKNKILEEYQKFRENYSLKAKKSVEKFLEIKKSKIKIKEKELLLSIIVPVYNTEFYISNCLNSVLKSLSRNLKDKTEIIVINDGSTDNSEKIIEKYINKYPNLIKYIKQKNHGLGNVRNVGLREAKGTYISSIDSDDTINKNFFKEAVKYMNDNVDIIVYDWLSLTNNGKFETSAIEWCFDNLSKYEGLLYSSIMPSTCNKIIKRELYDKLNIKYNEDKYEDLSTNPFLMLTAKTIKYINKPYYEYYIRSNSIMRSSVGYSMINVLKVVDNRFKKYINNINKINVEKFKFYTYSWRIEEFVINQLYLLKNEELKQFINYMYDNLYELMCYIFDNKYYINMLENIKDKEYIIERNKAFKNKKIEQFINKNKNAYKLTAPIIYFGDN